MQLYILLGELGKHSGVEVYEGGEDSHKDLLGGQSAGICGVAGGYGGYQWRVVLPAG